IVQYEMRVGQNKDGAERLHVVFAEARPPNFQRMVVKFDCLSRVVNGNTDRQTRFGLGQLQALRVGLLLQEFDCLAVEGDTGPVGGQVPQQGHVIEAADQVRMGGLEMGATQLQRLIAQGRRGYRITKSDVDRADLVQQSGADQRLALELGSV